MPLFYWGRNIISDSGETKGNDKSVQFTIPSAGNMRLFIANKKMEGFDRVKMPSVQKLISSIEAN